MAHPPVATVEPDDDRPLVLFFAWLAHVVGAPQLLGGFAAGLDLSRRFFSHLGWPFTLARTSHIAWKPK
jgi:hypothetical protein